MRCLFDVNDNLEQALEGLYERFGRLQFPEDEEDLPKIREILEAVQYAQFELEDYLESLQPTGPTAEELNGPLKSTKEVTAVGQLA